MNAALPLLLSFLSDRQSDVPLSVNIFVADILRLASVPVFHGLSLTLVQEMARPTTTTDLKSKDASPTYAYDTPYRGTTCLLIALIGYLRQATGVARRC